MIARPPSQVRGAPRIERVYCSGCRRGSSPLPDEGLLADGRRPEVSGADLEPFNRGIERLNALLFGFQDYEVIGRKGLVSAPA